MYVIHIYVIKNVSISVNKTEFITEAIFNLSLIEITRMAKGRRAWQLLSGSDILKGITFEMKQL